MLNKNHRKEDNGKNNNMNLFNPQFPLQMQWGRAGTIQKYSLTFISFTWLWDFCRNTRSMSTLYQSLWWPYLHPSLRLQVLCKRLSYLPPGELREFLQVFNFNSCLVSFFIVLCSDSLRLLCGSLVAFPPNVLLPCLQALFFPISGSEWPQPNLGQNFMLSSILREEWTTRDTHFYLLSLFFPIRLNQTLMTHGFFSGLILS